VTPSVSSCGADAEETTQQEVTATTSAVPVSVPIPAHLAALVQALQLLPEDVRRALATALLGQSEQPTG
jgi:hypothetical protein